MAKRKEIEKKFKELSDKLSKDESFSKEVTKLSEIIEQIESEDNNQARWPYVDAKPISEIRWRG